MPPSPILSLLVDDYGTYRHLTSTAPSPFRCSTVLLLHGRDAGARSSMTRPRAADPANEACAAEGVSSRPRCSLAGVHAWLPRCGALAHLFTPRGHLSAPPFPAWQGQRHTDKFLLALSPHKSPATVHLTARLRPRVHAHAVRARPSASHHLEPSCRSWCSPYKRDPHAIWSRPTTASLLDSGKPSPPCSTSISATLSMPSRLTRLPPSCAGPGAPFHLGDTPNRRWPAQASVSVRTEHHHW
jgi:hypothetical protein